MPENNISIEHILSKLERLPEPPQVAMRVRQMLEEEDTNADMLAEVIRVDPGFTGQILKLCNSAAYGLKTRVTTVKEAVAVLGFSTLKSMVYTILANSVLNHAVLGYSLQQGDLWYNSLNCAMYAKHLAKKEKNVDPEQAFTGALLHAIGKVILGDYVGAKYLEIEQSATQQRLDFLEAEEAVLGINHSQLGSQVAEKWGFPSVLVGCIQYYHKPSKAPDTFSLQDFRVITTVHMASLLTRMIGKGNGADGLMYTLDSAALERAQWSTFSSQYVEEVISELVELNQVIKNLADSMNIKM